VSDYLGLLGPLGYPLGVCSVIAFALIVERALFHARLRASSDRAGAKQSALQSGFRLLAKNAKRPRADREEVIALWLAGYAKPVKANIGWLTLIASIAPMLGLLGTVLGMTRAFKAIAAHDGPISPAILADGLWEAMLTTLVGLSIAIPTLVAVWVFRAMEARHLEIVVADLNRASLALDGIVAWEGSMPAENDQLEADNGETVAP